jgi:hypothetical protein
LQSSRRTFRKIGKLIPCAGGIDASPKREPRSERLPSLALRACLGHAANEPFPAARGIAIFATGNEKALMT